MEMYNFNHANYDGRLQELKREEERLEKYLLENGGSIASHESKRIENTLAGIRSEEQEINQLMSGGFY